ncbi:hypothetical protein SRB5_61640 [Streptomyces sp. RB5]|uniref:Phosphatidic acid phosphatase type 2/haloperoxidase domain-containing protein n=1 Tax=Streptomyces smaragdinus TaxID=2585196 RepID=A0A7K0CSI8_9ACTN|nr:phosphatase PAP2 family protein [Streptomyces smaragdinus]MQY15972.1 hypothetical protein [Streptomyces smaragdinus]
MLLVLVSWQVGVDGPLVGADEALSRDLVANAPPERVAEALSDLGGPVVAVPVLLAAVVFALWRGRWFAALAAAVAMALVPALVVPAKTAFARPGPTMPRLTDYAGFYPSGHATTSAVAYGAAAVLVAGCVHRAWVRRVAVGAAVLLSAGCGLGLTWHAYHWPLDVLAGWCLAVLLLWALVRLTARGAPTYRRR